MTDKRREQVCEQCKAAPGNQKPNCARENICDERHLHLSLRAFDDGRTPALELRDFLRRCRSSFDAFEKSDEILGLVSICAAHQKAFEPSVGFRSHDATMMVMGAVRNKSAFSIRTAIRTKAFSLWTKYHK